MISRLKNIIDLSRNMGFRYLAFRIRYELSRRTGWMKRRFPAAPPLQEFVTLADWKNRTGNFFFSSRKEITVKKKRSQELIDRLAWIESGKLLMFNSVLTDLGTGYDWITNPDSGFPYDANKHWTEIPDYSREAGDIKYVWEKSRFSYLYDIIRYDHHFDDDHAQQVFSDIISWISSNPVNCGPNYRCSQEMSLRVLNWTFALFFYRDSPSLTSEIFSKVQYAIYWHLHHVYSNINFSRIAVRNNHAITETLMLYLAGILYPTLPGAQQWKERGKKWFEEEIAYQVYEDGTFLQFSMNYHRVVVQLLTWAIVLSEKNGERFSDVVYDRARKSVQFLRTCMIDENGWLPNYGANDGALFFRLSDTHYRDYRPQVHALAAALGMSAGINEVFEDIGWYGAGKPVTLHWIPQNGAHSFRKGGYYVVREPDTLTFVKCGSYKDRPSQADNLHLDVWYKGQNILTDAGSYKYNTDAETIRYFSGTRSHNTVMLAGNDQMLKGGRFIWYYWTQCKSARLADEGNTYRFAGTISVFRHLSPGILHSRTIVKRKGEPVWEIHDAVSGAPAGVQMTQLWHIPAPGVSEVTLAARDTGGNSIQPVKTQGYSSSLYGTKDVTEEISFSSSAADIVTTIRIAPVL